MGDTRFAEEYTEEEKVKFEKYLEGQIAKIDLPNKDIPFLRNKILTMYANPLINYLEAAKGWNPNDNQTKVTVQLTINR